VKVSTTIIPLSASQLHYNLVTEGGCRYGGPFTFWFAGMPRKEPQPPKEASLLTWEIYLARSTPAKYVGRVEAADADAAIEAATKEFEVKDPKRLIAVRRA
jgi:hypothetical protein